MLNFGSGDIAKRAQTFEQIGVGTACSVQHFCNIGGDRMRGSDYGLAVIYSAKWRHLVW